MKSRLFLWVLSTVFGVRRAGWIVVVAPVLFRFFRKTTRRVELIDLSSVPKGQRLVIEHLDRTHKQQIKKDRKPKRGSKRTELVRWRSHDQGE